MLTKYTDTELRREITVLLDKLQKHREPLSPVWVTHTICKDHAEGLAPEPDGNESVHRAFWRYGGYTITRKLATACINDRDDPLRATTGNILVGPVELALTLVQDYYVVTRDGDDLGVPTETMTVDELRAKADLYEHNSRKLSEHAGQLRRYAQWREAQVPVTV